MLKKWSGFGLTGLTSLTGSGGLASGTISAGFVSVELPPAEEMEHTLHGESAELKEDVDNEDKINIMVNYWQI